MKVHSLNNSFTNKLIDSFNEGTTLLLDSQRKRITIIVVAVFALLAIGYLIYSKYFKATKMDKDETKILTDIDKKAIVNIEVTFPEEIKTFLDQLFEGSPYAIDTLPVYPILLNHSHAFPKRERMTAPVVKGISQDGRRFIAIKVDSTLTDGEIEKIRLTIPKELHSVIKHHLQEVLVLSQYHADGPVPYGGEGKFKWDQLSRSGFLAPLFFSGNFTYAEDGSGPTESQKENYKLMRTLLTTGKSPDINGQIWHIAPK